MKKEKEDISFQKLTDNEVINVSGGGNEDKIPVAIIDRFINWIKTGK